MKRTKRTEFRRLPRRGSHDADTINAILDAGFLAHVGFCADGQPLFLYLVIAWWIFYRWRNQQTWTFFLFVFVLISPTILFLCSRLLFPPENALDELVDYKKHYYANHRAFFIIFALFSPVDIVDSLLKGVAHFTEL